MKLDNLGWAIPQEYLSAALMLSLFSVWVLVLLFFYFNRYERRDHLAIWAGAWLCYAFWLTLSVRLEDRGVGSLTFAIKQSLVSASALMLLWGTLRFRGQKVGWRLFAAFVGFLGVWIFVSTQVVLSVLLTELPVFILLGFATPLSGLCLLQLRKQKALIGAGMLLLGFLLWGIYLGSYPFAHQYGRLYASVFFAGSLLQFLVSAGLIALILEQIRLKEEQIHCACASAPTGKILDSTKSLPMKDNGTSPSALRA